MKPTSQLLLCGAIALSWPLDAHAQRIPALVVVLAAMPLLAAILCLALGVVMKSWFVGAGNLALLGLWVVWFAAAAMYSPSDLMTWAPIGALGLHLAAMAALIAVRAVHRRVRVIADGGPVAGIRRAPNMSGLEEGSLTAGLQAHYSARDIEARILAAIRAAGLSPEQRLSPEELGALDHFHTGGLRASRELAELAQIRAEDRILDIGAGLAGPARLLASELGCRVVCIDLSPDYCAGAVLLNRLTGLGDRIEVHNGSALDLPFADGSFDVVWMQNVGMNIADKRRLYAEVCRVLKPDGRFAFQEMAAGETATSYFPLPWATQPADSFLVSAQEIRSLLGENGFVPEHFEDTSDAQLSRTVADAAPNPLTLGVYVDNLAQKAGNARRSLQEGQIRLVRGVFRAK